MDPARSIPRGDDEVDNLYRQVSRVLLSYILEDRHVIEQANYLLWAAHNLERAADRVTNLGAGGVHRHRRAGRAECRRLWHRERELGVSRRHSFELDPWEA